MHRIVIVIMWAIANYIVYCYELCYVLILLINTCSEILEVLDFKQLH